MTKLLSMALVLVLVSAAAAGAQTGTFTSTFVARWNLSNGKYQVDIGQYLEAIEAFNTAIEMSTDAELRAEAMLEKANVLAVFLDAPDEAIRVYDELLARYPKSSLAEAAQFRAGMVLFDRGRYGPAAAYFERYVKRYPKGPSRGSAEFLLGQSRAKATLPPTLPPAPHAAPPPPAAPPVAVPAAGASATVVRVRILRGHDAVTIRSQGALTLTPAAGGGNSIDVQARGGLVSVGGQQGVRELTVAAAAPLQLSAGRVTRHYRGSVTVRADGSRLLLINRVGIEEYLYGVVTKESVASWPLEALKAQAVASRTYALYQVQHRQEREYDMVDDEGSQVYGGIEGESAAGRRAVDETRGMILRYRGRTVYAMFTANSGWYTADPASIFDQPLPYLVAVPDPYSPSQQMGHWARRYSGAEIRRKLADIGVQLGAIRTIAGRVTDPSGRIVRVEITDDHGAHVMRTRPTLGRALNLPEILLNVQHNGDEFVFAGGGFGHGVGLSQWGAKAMAAQGSSVKDILAFYYRGADITPLSQ